MARIAARVERPIKIHRQNGRERYHVHTLWAFNLPDAMRQWYHQHAEVCGFSEPLFTANTVTLRTRDGREETYVATD